jgi:thymidylate kinase
MAARGLFIVLYGPSGVGKSKQMVVLEDQMKKMGISNKKVEYPIYDLGEAGKRLKRIVWKLEAVPSEEELQELFAQNRRDFEPTLKSWLESGVNVIAEDYKGTGMVWGVTRGIPIEKMEDMNKDFMEPDISILIDGPRRLDLRPGEGHIYNTDEEEWYKARKVYLQLADKYGWVRVGGDAPMYTVAGRIWTIVKLALAMRGR